jgi:hypothetical protein
VASAADTTTHVPAQLPEGAMTLTDEATGTPVPVMAGYPKAVPYSPDSGEHVVDIQPAADLAACTTYRVDVTDRLLDAAGRPVTPMHRSFRTAGCPEEPSSTSTTTATTSPTTRSSSPGAPGGLAAVAVTASPRFTG